MEQVLSQDEIDALLKGLSDGEIEAPPPEVEVEPQVEAKTFDFLKYTKGKKEKLPALEFICDRSPNPSGLPCPSLSKKRWRRAPRPFSTWSTGNS